MHRSIVVHLMANKLELHLEYASLLARYRKLAAGPFADGAEFQAMQRIASRLEEISVRLYQMPAGLSVTDQFSSLDQI